MNGDTATAAKALRKPRPEIQIYRPGMLRSAQSTKSLEGAKPPQPDRLPDATTPTSSFGSSRRRSNDTDSVTSRGESGSTTPDANRFDGTYSAYNNRRGNDGAGSSYNSTQSLYDTRRQGGYTEYGKNRTNNRNSGQGNYRQQNQHHQHQNHHNPNPRRDHFNRGFNERASMRGDGAIAKRPTTGGGRRRNDSINSTQSEMPPATSSQLHVDTTFDSASVNSMNSMNSLNSAFSFEEMCQNLQNFASMDWSKEVENEFAAQKEREEEEERLRNEELENQKAPGLQNSPRNHQQKRNRQNQNNRNHRRGQHHHHHHDESDRESSFGGSIAEENEEEDCLKSGERTPTSITSSVAAYHPRGFYQRPPGPKPSRNTENEYGTRRKAEKKGYRGEHDDREDSQYDGIEQHMSFGRLAGRISIVQREQPVEQKRSPLPQAKADEVTARIQKRSAEMPPREVLNRRRKEEIDRNEGVQIRQCAEKIEKLANLVKKRDVKAAESMVKISIELANIYQQVILPDVIYSFTAGLEQKLFRQAFYRTIEVLRSGANSADPDSKRIRAVLQKLLLNGILFYEQLIRQYEQEFHVELDTALTWPSGSPTSSELVENCINLPVGIQKFESAIQKTAIKSLSRHLISLGDFHRYKSLVDGSENYEVSKTYYQKSAQLWPATGHPYNQLGVVVYYSKRVIDEFFYLMRSLACTHPYEAARDRLTQRLDAMRAKVGKYQPVLDKECGKVKSDAATLKKNMRLIRQIWIHPISQKVEDGTGERIVDDILSHFQAQSKTKLHRRAVSYLCDVFGILVTKIGMDHFQSVSERAFGLLYASLSKPETDFSPDQLVKLAAMSIYAVQVNFTKSDNLQVQIALNTLITFYTILIQNYLQDTNKTLLLPAIHVLSIWICHPETQVLEKTERLESLPSTILTDSAKNTILAVLEQIPAEKTVIDATKTYPEAILMASFFKCFEANPTGATFTTSGDLNSARLQAMRKAAERVRELVENEKVEDPPASTDSERLREEPRSRQQIMEEEREKGTVTIVTLPEYLIPDTNVLIGDLQLLKDLLDAKMYQILVPTTVIDELSHLAQPSSSTSTSDDAHDPERFSKARQALVWLREQAKLRTPGLHTLTTTGKRLATLILASEEVEAEKNTNNDDKILKSAIEWTNQLPTPPTSSPLHTVATQFQQADGNTGGGVQLKSCVLLTGDRGLTIKAVGSHVPCRTVENFVKWAVPGAQ